MISVILGLIVETDAAEVLAIWAVQCVRNVTILRNKACRICQPLLIPADLLLIVSLSSHCGGTSRTGLQCVYMQIISKWIMFSYSHFSL